LHATEQPRVAVVGAGITGAYAAYFLAGAGAAVTLIERDAVAGAASGHNAGGLNPLHGPGVPGPLADLALAALALHVDAWPTLRTLSAGGFGERFLGRWHVALDAAEAEGLAAREALHNRTPGFSAHWLDAAELGAREPRVTPDAVGALWTEGNARVDPDRYTRAVVRAAVQRGAVIHRAEAVGLRHSARRVSGVQLADGTLACDAVVLATGPWCESVEAWLGLSLWVEPVKGELLRTAPPAVGLSADITAGSTAVYPAADGSLWLGGTEDRTGLDAVPTAGARERILAGVRRLVPGLGELPILEHIAALRPVTADGLPLVGRADGWDNVGLALGSGRKGMLLSAALGRAVADLVLTGATELPIEPCAPGRLAALL
jgi:glycine oxidase